MTDKIKAILIIEVAGRPPEFLKNSLEIHVQKIKNFQKGISLVNFKLAEPKKIDEEKDLYTMFAEVEVETETYGKLMELVFEFMPSSVEIIDPAEITFDIQEATMLMNDLAGRLHKYDEVAKIARMQVQQLAQRLQQNNVQKPAIQPVSVTMENNTVKPAKKKNSSKSKKAKKK